VKTTRPLIAILFALLVAAPGCGQADADPTAALPSVECVDADGDGLGAGCEGGSDCDDSDASVGDCTGPQPTSNECEDGATRECKVTLKQNGGVQTCFVGVEVCEGGQWGACGAES
jgi:hypothetical protein